jgi:hypothetical protein
VGGERDQAGLRRYLDAVTFEESPAPLRGPLEFLLRALQKLDWSADKYGLIGIAFALQSWLLLAGFVVVIGAVVGAVVVQRHEAAAVGASGGR